MTIDLDNLAGRYPILAICYGAQLICHYFGGEVKASDKREYGRSHLYKTINDALFEGLKEGNTVWMSHADTINKLPAQFESVGHTKSIPVAIFRSKENAFSRPIYGLQFHPEVTHTENGIDFSDIFCLILPVVTLNGHLNSLLSIKSKS